MTNSADPDQLASEEVNQSGATLFAKARHIRVQQDKGKGLRKCWLCGPGLNYTSSDQFPSKKN